MPHEFHIYKGRAPQRDFKIGVAVPCYIDDVKFLERCLEAIERLNPQPYLTIIDVNWGSDLCDVRTKLFNRVFEEGCDVVFQNSADFYLMPDVLKYVSRDKIVSFNPICLRRYDLTFGLYHMLFFSKMGWTGCYSMPKPYWLKYKDKFTGDDGSIWRQVGRFRYDFHLGYGYYNMRPYRKSSIEAYLATLTLPKRLLWRMVRMGIG